MEKILILGGTHFQVPVIQYSKEQGYRVITCDYLPDNPGHLLSDEYYNVSTTDKEAVLDLARGLKVDGVLAFASDPAAPTAAYVAEKLGLPGNSFNDVNLFSEKHKWRNFLKENGFRTPVSKDYYSLDELMSDEWCYPVMVKPVDSSGSKGVTKVSGREALADAFSHALSYSRSRHVIVEEYIERAGPQIGGDGFFGTDRLDFVCFGDQVVDEGINPYVPCGMKFPSIIPESIQKKISDEIERAIRLSGLKNLSFNLEVMLDERGDVFLMEIGPRNGGNCIPEVIYNYTGVNLPALAVEASLGHPFSLSPRDNSHFYAYYALHSRKDGIYRDYVLRDTFPGILNGEYVFLKDGDNVGAFMGSNQTIGILLLEFELRSDMDLFFQHPEEFVSIIVE